MKGLGVGHCSDHTIATKLQTQGQGQPHFARAPAGSVWSTSYKTKWIALRSWKSTNLSYLLIGHPPRDQLLLPRRERWILTFIHWLGPLLYLLGCFVALIVIWSERLAKDPYQKSTLQQWGSNQWYIDCKCKLFYQLSHPSPDIIYVIFSYLRFPSLYSVDGDGITR